MKPLDAQRDKSEDKQPHTKKDKDKLIKKYTQHLSKKIGLIEWMYKLAK